MNKMRGSIALSDVAPALVQKNNSCLLNSSILSLAGVLHTEVSYKGRKSLIPRRGFLSAQGGQRVPGKCHVGG